jgi:hypothetical protein
MRQPRHMVDYRRHFAFVVLNEFQLRAIDFEEEICFRFWLHIEFALAAVIAHGLPSQLISLSPDCQFNSSGKESPIVWFVFNGFSAMVNGASIGHSLFARHGNWCVVSLDHLQAE